MKIFGPVVCVYSYDDVAAAIDAANGLPTAFQAAVFSSNMAEAMHIYRNLDASAVMLNDHTAFRDDVMPFAGLRESGLGVGGNSLHVRGHADRQAVHYQGALSRRQPERASANTEASMAEGSLSTASASRWAEPMAMVQPR